jgi:hypothetical protein
MTRIDTSRRIAIRNRGGIEFVDCPVISHGLGFDVVKKPDGKLWPVISTGYANKQLGE